MILNIVLRSKQGNEVMIKRDLTETLANAELVVYKDKYFKYSPKDKMWPYVNALFIETNPPLDITKDVQI